VTKRDVGTVGHLPSNISSSCSVFLQMGGAIGREQMLFSRFRTRQDGDTMYFGISR